ARRPNAGRPPLQGVFRAGAGPGDPQPPPNPDRYRSTSERPASTRPNPHRLNRSCHERRVSIALNHEPASSPGLSRRPRIGRHRAIIIGVAGTSPATTCGRGVRLTGIRFIKSISRAKLPMAVCLSSITVSFALCMAGADQALSARNGSETWRTKPDTGGENLDDGPRSPRHRLFRRYSSTKSESLTEL